MQNVLTIAGSDCSGGAGIQADLKTFAAHGAYGMSVVTAVVAENTSRVLSVHQLAPADICDQLDAVFEDIPVHAVKVGMLGDACAMRAVGERLRRYAPRNVVIDPVMVAKGGSALMQPQALETLVRDILPLAALLTPNIPEAQALSGRSISTPEDMRAAAVAIQRMGAAAVLVKGGHLAGDAQDILFDGKRFTSYRSERIPTKNTHGTGCTFSSAIAANLANGLPLGQAVEQAKEYVTMAIRHALPIGKGHGPTHHFYRFFPHTP